MRSRRFAFGVGFALTLIACLLFAHLNATLSDNTGRTLRDGGAGCAGCHGSASANVTVSITGPSQVAAGNTGAYTMTTHHSSPDFGTSVRVGLDIASSDFSGLATSDTATQLLGAYNEITHTTSAKSLANDGTCALPNKCNASYTFNYTIPGGALPGSAHTIYAASTVAFQGWRHASNFNVIVPLGGSPSSVSILGSTSGSLTLQWGSPSSAAYQITYKSGATPPTNPNDGIKRPLVFNQNTLEVTGLSPSTQYSFSVWGASEKPAGSEPGTQLYSANPPAQVTGSTQPVPPNTYPLRRTGNMGTARFGHTATLLANGKVLIAGGLGTGSTPLQSAELYDPASGTFSSTGSMSVARSGHTATPLPNGKVLIAGGHASNTVAELYDPVSGTFSNTGMMATTRSGHTATLLNNGKVLIAGGTSSVAAADLYDPSNGTFSPTLNMTANRFFHTATLLTNGKVLLAGGSTTAVGTSLTTAEVYDPAGNNFSATGNNMNVARKNHTATALINASSGLVRLQGGIDTAGNSINSYETYDSSGNTFGTLNTGPYATAKHTATLLPYVGSVLITGGRASNGNSLDTIDSEYALLILSEPRASHTATLLPGERVLIAGGSDTAGIPIASAEVYDTNLFVRSNPNFVQGAFYATSNMTAGRAAHAATLLANGKVLIAGGSAGTQLPDFCYEWDSAELYDGAFTATGSMTQHRTQHSATLLPNGKVLIAGGQSQCPNQFVHPSAELYDPNSGTFTATGSMATGRYSHSATLLANGKVLIAGGYGPSALLGSAELYDPNSGTFSPTGNMTTPRQNHTATLLPNGKVFIAGGSDNTFTSLYSAELYDPNSGTFTASNATVYYQIRRERHMATLLPTGKVLIADGANSTNGSAYGSIPTGLLYDPATDDYSLVSCCIYQTNVMGQNGGRWNARATLLPDGRVLMTGGQNEGPSGGRLATAEVYDPALGSFKVDNDFDANIGHMVTARESHTATLLPGGRVLVAGGTGPGGTYLNSAEEFRLYKEPTAPQPVITSAPATLFLPAAINITGTGLRAAWEASSGSGQSSPADLPLLELQRVDNEQIVFIRPSARDATTFTSPIQSGLADGHYRATIFASGVPSVQALIAIRTVPLVGPTSVSATATNATSVAVTWSAVSGAATYEILRTEDNVNYVSRSTVSGTALTDSAQSGKAYLYKVHAIDALGVVGPDSAPDLATTVIFNDDPVVAGATPVRALHITQLRTAVNAVRTLAGQTGGTFAETITAGSTTIKASHILELRSALTPARSALGLSPVSYTDPSLTSGFAVKAAHINQLRDGVK